MSLLSSLNFLRRPASQALSTEPTRSRDGRFSPSPKTQRERSLYASVKMQLATYCKTTTPAQRARAMQEHVAIEAVRRALSR